jgi:DNA-binding NarL/FixJ family response regulator
VSRDPGNGSLVGRHTEIDQLARAVDRLDRGSPTVIDLVAEPGMGKTTLLAELTRLLGDRPVLRASATEHDHAHGVLRRAIDTPPEQFPAALLDRAARTGTALLLDDLHHADPDSLILLDNLLTTLPDTGLLVAVAYRPRQAPRRLLATLAAPELTRRVTRLELAPLCDRDAATLVGVGRDDVVAAGGGNPLYLRVLARVGESADVPAQVRATVLSDVDSATPAARRLATAATVLDEPFDPDVALEIAGLDHATASSSVDELHRRDILRSASGTLLRFRHPLLRKLIYDETPPGWRRSAHRAAIAALRGRGASVLTQAPHLEQCASAGDLDAVALLIEAADLAGRRAPANAARWLRAALALVPDADRATWLPQRVRLARFLVLAGRYPEARDTLRDLGDDLPPERRTEVVVLRATVERMLGNHNAARRRLTAEFELSTSDTAAELAIELSTVDVMEGVVTARTVELANRASTTQGVARVSAHAVAATAAHLLGDLDAAIAARDDAAGGLDALPDTELAERLDACLWTGWVENAHSRYLVGLAHFDRGIELARHTGRTHLLCHLLAGRALGQRWLGRLPAARRDADEAVDVAKACRSDELRALATGTRAWIGIAGEDLEAARAEADAVVQLAGPATGWWATQARFVAALAQAECGEPGQAGQRLLTVGGGPDLPRVDPAGRPAWYELLTRSAVADGDRARAETWSVRAAASADDRLPLGAGLAALARVESLRPADPDASQHARRAVELFAAIGAPIEQARAITVLAGCLAATGQTTGARKLARRAAERYEACGATRLAAQARAPFGDAVGRPALSPREREVATLVSHGCTNKQIAVRLHVTEKTVETYLSRIFSKLDLNSRAALAAWVVAVS